MIDLGKGYTMKTWFERTAEEKNIINKAYEFEINAIETLDNTPNPYIEEIKAMGLWEAFNEAIEMKYN